MSENGVENEDLFLPTYLNKNNCRRRTQAGRGLSTSALVRHSIETVKAWESTTE